MTNADIKVYICILNIEIQKKKKRKEKVNRGNILKFGGLLRKENSRKSTKTGFQINFKSLLTKEDGEQTVHLKIYKNAITKYF